MFPRLASAVAVCALASVTVACTTSDRDGPARSASGAPQPLADAGPRPGALRPVWHLDGRKRPASASPVTFDLAGGRLLVKTGDRITLHDARTGAARWHYTEPGLQVGAHAATRATLVVAMRTATSTSHLVGLDAGDGRRLWERKDVSPGRTDVIPAGAGVVAVIEKAGEVVGIDASTGRERWTWEGDPALDCRLGLPWLSGPNPVDGVILVRESCYPGDAAVDPARSIRALDPATGRSLWRRPAPAESNVRAESRRGVTMLRTGSWGTEGFAILGRDGRELLKQGRVPRCPADTCFEVAGEWVIVPYGEPGAQRAIHVVNIRNGRTATYRHQGDYRALATAGGRVYALKDWLARPLLPAGLDIIDPVTGRIDQAPVVLAGWRGAREADVTWLGVGGERIFVADPAADRLRVRLTSYASAAPAGAGAPAKLGGVRVRDWPNACRLLADPVGWRADPDYLPRVGDEPIKVGEQTLPRATCYYEKGDSRVRTMVAWVTATARQADELLVVDRPEAEPVSGVGDEAYLAQGPVGRPALITRAGRYLVTFETIDGPESAARELAGAVAASLRSR